MFNPLAYALIQAFGWRWAYGVFASILLVVGLICCSTFSPANTDNNTSEILNDTETNSPGQIELNEPQGIPEDSRSEEDLHLRRPTIVFYSILWLLCAFTKGLGYHTPAIILVCIVCIYICEQGM